MTLYWKVGRGAFNIALLLLLLVVCNTQHSQAQTLAFPGAEGFGKYATGGRTGSVYHVTNLNDSGTGSLRDALSKPNRIVVFDVGGVIKITSRMIVSANIYIAGQTAPGEGITVYGNGWSFSGAHNTICRYIKIRMGATGDSGKDAIGIAEGQDLIFDHCSVSWGRDETFSINSPDAARITIQNCVISQGLLTHSAGGLIQTNGGVTLYRNLYVDNDTRNNKVKGVNQYTNNVVYHWKSGAYIMGGDSEGESFVNATGNVFIKGPSDAVSGFNGANALFHIYAEDNWTDTTRDGVFNPHLMAKEEYRGGPDFKTTPYGYPALPTLKANSLLDDLLPTVGASLPYRDLADYYVVNEVKSFGKKGEFLSNENVLPFGVPTNWNLWGGNLRTDTDKDGMPDTWETANGTNPNADDAMTLGGTGYTNIERYINSITEKDSQFYLRKPWNLKTESATSSSIKLTWFDYTEKETGYVVERKVNGTFVVIGQVAANNNTFEVSGLAPAEADTFRVKAISGAIASEYSNEWIAKSKPKEVEVLDPAKYVPNLTWTGSVSKVWDKTTANWQNNSIAKTFSDSTQVLFAEAGTTAQNISITDKVGIKNLLVQSDGDYQLTGTGAIQGPGSVNKTGKGTLALLTDNTYTGATVLHLGTLEINKLANGGLASSIGASPNYAFNWVWRGGKIRYTGGNASTDRSVNLDATTELEVSDPNATLTLTGVLTGDGGFIKSGEGRVVLRSANPYLGETTIKKGVLEISPISTAVLADNIINEGAAIGTSNVLRLAGGTFRTSNGSTSIYENYPMHLIVETGSNNFFEPFRNANIACKVSGSGTLTYSIPYLRELIQGDWSEFTGTLIAKGINTSDGSIFMIDNGMGIPNARVVTSGNTKIASYSNNEILYLGGLSGSTGTMLSCGGTKTASFGNGFTTYVVGAAGTDEVFDGVINNHLYGNSADGNGTTTIIKDGKGNWTLTGNNTYIGTTTITDGKLTINGNNNGTGKVTVSETGTLAGKGSIAGEVEIQATLAPGDNGIGNLTIKNNLVLTNTSTTLVDVTRGSSITADKITVSKDLSVNGTLQINLTGTPQSGDLYPIFKVTGKITGTFSKFIPEKPGVGLEWQFLPATGELRVQTSDFVEAPTNLTLSAISEKLPTPNSSVTCKWTDKSNNESNFIIERSLDSLTFIEAGQTAANITAFTVTGLTPNTKYYFRIKAKSATASSLYSSIVGIKTPPASNLEQTSTPIPANGATDVSENNTTQITLSWTGSNATSYDIWWGTSSSNLQKLKNVATTSSKSPDLNASTTYYWRVDAIAGADTIKGMVWNFKTASLLKPTTGDYRTASSGNWGSSSVTTTIWETYNGTTWVATNTIPSGVVPPATPTTNTIVIRNGHTVTLNATTIANNLIIENGATLKSGTSDGLAGTAAQRNIRVSKSILNYGTVGSSSTSTERVNFEGYLDNGTITIGGSSTYYLNNFNVNSIAQKVSVDIEANLNISAAFRANYSTATTSPWSGASQNDDDISITIKEGKTVTLGSSAYLQASSSPTTNTITEFGNYTFHINGILDMRATGTSCIVEHLTLPSNLTINVNGVWQLGNAIRFVTTGSAIPAGKVLVNIGATGIIDAGARTLSGSAATNIVITNTAIAKTNFFNVTHGGLLKQKVSTSDVLFALGNNQRYYPVKVANTATADIIGVSLTNWKNMPHGDSTKIVKQAYQISASTLTEPALSVTLGWTKGDEGSKFAPMQKITLGSLMASQKWNDSTATITGEGSLMNPFYAKTGRKFTPNTTYMLGNASALAYKLLKFELQNENNDPVLQWSLSNEVNTAKFELLRKTKSDTVFRSIAQINTKGNYPQVNQYIFKDSNAPFDTLYYQLKIYDIQDNTELSEVTTTVHKEIILATEYDLASAVKLYPQPCHDYLTVAHPIGTTYLKIVSLFGKICSEQPVVPGSTSSTIAVEHLSNGIYLVELKHDHTILYYKFIKN